MVSFPPCKINLGLHIINKRPDGYHNLETCFHPIPWTDVLEIIPATKFSFTSSGIAIPGSPEQNLCVRAYQLLSREFSIDPVSIHLHKIIPMGAGLGGGSADAAHTIRLLDDIFGLDLPREKMMQYASSIGSDTAFFIQDDAMFGQGRGEILSTINVSLRGKFIVLVNPDIHVSTAEAYSQVTPMAPKTPLAEVLAMPITEWTNVLTNDFEISVFSNHPRIKEVKQKLYSLGATYASMSGSGATVFGIFQKEFNAESEFPGTTVWANYL